MAVGPELFAHPPRVPLVLRLGVTGHRPEPTKRVDADPAATRAVAVRVLSIIRTAVDRVADVGGDVFAVSNEGGPDARIPPRLRIVSALAAGPDQWVAGEAVALGCELQCVLPFHRDEYREDFRPGPDCHSPRAAEHDRRLSEAAAAEAEYRRLLDIATATFELDGRVDRPEPGVRRPDGWSYAAVGRAILRQSDLLVAVWDGQPARGPGGTGEVVDAALGRGIPVVWITWGRPTTWQLLLPAWRYAQEPGDSRGDEARLLALVRELLLPPEDPDGQTGREDLRREYFREGRKRGNPLRGCWTLFESVLAAQISRTDSRNGASVRDHAARESTTGRSVADAPAEPLMPGHVQRFVDEAFLPHYAWANGLSVHYGGLHRGAFLVNSLLGAAAVFLALVSIAAGIAGREQAPWIVAELFVILAILGLTHMGQRRRWHQRWIDYRTLAERLRVARCMSLLGGGNPQVLHAGHLASYGNPLRTWMHWHHQAIERAAGLLPGVSVTGEYLAACREFWLEGLVDDQRRYHETTGDRLAKLDRRLHRAGDSLFALTLVACLLHVGHIWVDGGLRFAWVPGWAPGWLTLLCAFLPAAGAAFAAIRSQAETQRLAQRSRAMQDALGKLRADLAEVPTGENALNFQRLRDCADRVSELMIREMLDWRVVFQDRPLNLPV